MYASATTRPRPRTCSMQSLASADKYRTFKSLPLPQSMMKVAQIEAQHICASLPVDVSRAVKPALDGMHIGP
jgi:hypothetical protein